MTWAARSYAILFVFGTLRDCILYLNVWPAAGASSPERKVASYYGD